MSRKGIVLAGGSGTRLHPSTLVTSKQLLPIYDKPMIFYPLSILMLSGIREILIISKPDEIYRFKKLLGDGKKFGISLEYAVQMKPNGIAEALIIAEKFIKHTPCALILGDNLFFGQGLLPTLLEASKLTIGATIFGYKVRDPERYGVIEFGKNGEPIGIIEKPARPPSGYAVTGLYFYDEQAVDIAKSITVSNRGELEISDVNQQYLNNNKLKVSILSRGTAWLDTGTHDSLLEASQFVQTIQKRQGLIIACLEEIAWKNNWISSKELSNLARDTIQPDYRQYLFSLNDKKSTQ